MKKIIFKKSLIIIILISGLFLVLNFGYNQKREILAQEEVLEETLVICEDTAGGVKNKLEIPIGRTTDEVESLAKKIVKNADEMILAVQREMGYAGAMIALAQDCGVDYCKPHCHKEVSGFWGCSMAPCGNPCNKCPSCPPIQPYCCCYTTIDCEARPCEGLYDDVACPLGIGSTLNSIIAEANIIDEKLNKIIKLMNEMREMMEELKKSRKRLLDCFLRSPTEEEALLKEYTGLMNCASLLSAEISIHSILDNELQKGCYGNKYCQAVGKLEPCAEDFFCCY